MAEVVDLLSSASDTPPDEELGQSLLEALGSDSPDNSASVSQEQNETPPLVVVSPQAPVADPALESLTPMARQLLAQVSASLVLVLVKQGIASVRKLAFLQDCASMRLRTHRVATPRTKRECMKQYRLLTT